LSHIIIQTLLLTENRNENHELGQVSILGPGEIRDHSEARAIKEAGVEAVVADIFATQKLFLIAPDKTDRGDQDD